MWKRDQSATPSSAPRDYSTDAVHADSRSAEKLVMDLGKSVVIKGELSGSEDLTLSGQMEGSIKLPAHTLTIGSHADIKAEISAKTVVTNPPRGSTREERKGERLAGVTC